MLLEDTPDEFLIALNLVRGTVGPRPQSLDLLERRQVEQIRTIFQDPNIVGIGISEKITENRHTGSLALCFYVERKLPVARRRSGKLVPSIISVADRKAVFTDVQEVGKVRPQVNKLRSPIRSGYSVGSSTGIGTLGAIVQKGKELFLLSNSHVIANSGHGKLGDPIFYPAQVDADGAPQQKVAELSEVIPFQLGGDFSNRIDAALALIDASFLNSIDHSVYKARIPLSHCSAIRGMAITMRGRTSAESEGIVQDVHFSVVMPYKGVGTVGFIDQIKCSRYSQPGDSGSLIVEKDGGNVVGLHFAGSEALSVFNPISAVIDTLQIGFPNWEITS